MKRLLVLDDERDVAATICMIAASADYAADHTDDCNVFLEKVVSWAPTHVAVDLQLAELDGVEVLHMLAEMRCEALVIIISGLEDRILQSSARVATESGLRLAGILSKPFSRSDLLTMLAFSEGNQSRAQNLSINMGPQAVDREQLADALRYGALVAHFQPKVSCVSGALTGFESLARWPQQNGTMISPDRFIRVAEQTGLIHELTRQVYEYALLNLPAPVRESKLKIALNLSPINLNDESFPHWLMDKCEKYRVAPSQIILEITETASMDDPLSLLEKLTQFRIKGFSLSIDDFGVGYSSLVQLARLPFSELKIDQMFVKNLGESEESRKIVSAVVGLGSSLGLNLVAEGVEDEWAMAFLRDIGCHEAQGNFIASPMDRHAASSWEGCLWRGVT